MEKRGFSWEKRQNVKKNSMVNKKTLYVLLYEDIMIITWMKEF